MSSKLFVLPVGDLLLFLAAVAFTVAAFRLLAWLFHIFTHEEEEYQHHQQRHHRGNWQEEYCRWKEPQGFHQDLYDDYAMLGLKRGATLAEVKAAYRRLAKKYHPDAGGDPEKFKRVHAAYQNIVMGR